MIGEQIQIFKHYGYEHQLLKLVEEMRELEAVIINEPDNVEHIQEEMADVLNLIDQFMYCCPQWAIQVYKIKDFKVQRQMKRMKQEQEVQP